MIDHEFNHGIYFTQADYKNAAGLLWANLDSNSRRFALAQMNKVAQGFYDFNDIYDLQVREFIAFFHDPEDLYRNLNPNQAGTQEMVNLHQKLLQLAEKVIAIDRYSHVYQH